MKNKTYYQMFLKLLGLMPGGERPGATGVGKDIFTTRESVIERDGKRITQTRHYRVRRRKNPFRGICSYNGVSGGGLGRTYHHAS
jgi:hypothetical protein